MTNKSKIFSIITITILVVGIGYFWLSRDNSSKTSNSTAPIALNSDEAESKVAQSDAAQSESVVSQQDESKTASASPQGAYVDYTQNAVASAVGTRVLFFHAPWCPQCRQLDESIRAAELPTGVTIYKVDYDSNQSLRQKYGVTIQTTLVLLDKDGNMAKKYVAYDDPTFAALKNNLL